jgi:hypothetical protein
MEHNRTDRSVPNRSSNMEQAEGSRESGRDNERMSGEERMRNRESSSEDLGSSSDRAMFSDRETAEPRSGAASEERGVGASSERNLGESDVSGGGGISNRDLEREQMEQEELPERGHSQSER